MNIPFSVPDEHPVYAGHFPGRPIVPGAMLIAWITNALRDEGVQIAAVRSCKFLLPVLPGARGALQCRPTEREVVVELVVDGQVCVRLTGRNSRD